MAQIRRIALGRARSRGLGASEWGPVGYTGATFLIGRNKGVQDRSRTGSCAVGPKKYNLREMDDLFRSARDQLFKSRLLDPKTIRMAKPVEHEFAASRVAQRGWYEGVDENSAAYTLIHTGDVRGEEGFEKFRTAMRFMAETMAKNACQDSVLVVLEHKGHKTTEAFSSNEPTIGAGGGALNGARYRITKRRR